MGEGPMGEEENVNKFNEYFASVFTVENTEHVPVTVELPNYKNSAALTQVALTMDLVRNKLDVSPRLLNHISSPGYVS